MKKIWIGEVIVIIWLASYPRSGNTYFRILLKRYLNVDSYSIYDDKPLATDRNIADLVGHRERRRTLPELVKASEVFIMKTHELPQDDFRAIYLVRDGRDVLVSYAHYILAYEQKGGAEVSQETFHHTLRDLILYNASFAGWGPNVLAWSQRSSPTVIIKFEDLISSPKPSSIVKKALDEVGYSINLFPTVSKSHPSFSDLHDQMPEFFREGKIGAWKNEMHNDLHDLFWEKHGDAMRKIGYTK